MQARMTNPAMIVPDAMQALITLATCVNKSSVPKRTLFLVYLRVSQINGCSWCVDMHSHELQEDGDADQRIFAVAAWRDTAWFTNAERAALALAEAATRLNDRPNPVPDEIWEEATRHYDEQALGALILAIASINVWNRLNVTTRQVPGSS